MDIVFISYAHIRNSILSIRIWIRLDIKFSDLDTDYPYRLLTFLELMNIEKYPSHFYPYRRVQRPLERCDHVGVLLVARGGAEDREEQRKGSNKRE
jgi:hypothetical protein